MASLTLYTNAFSNHSNIVNNFVAAAGLSDKIAFKIVALEKQENKSAEFLKINPSGQVPALIDHEVGITIYESSSIVRYLAHKFPQQADFLYPTQNLRSLGLVDTAYEHMRQKIWDHSSGLIFHRFIVPVFQKKEPDQQRVQQCLDNLDRTLEHVALNFFKDGASKWVLGGERLSLADIVLGTILTHLELVQYKPKSPRLEQFLHDFKSEPFYAKTLFATRPGQ